MKMQYLSSAHHLCILWCIVAFTDIHNPRNLWVYWTIQHLLYKNMRCYHSVCFNLHPNSGFIHHWKIFVCMSLSWTQFYFAKKRKKNPTVTIFIHRLLFDYSKTYRWLFSMEIISNSNYNINVLSCWFVMLHQSSFWWGSVRYTIKNKGF